jgi:hypothetical protein
VLDRVLEAKLCSPTHRRGAESSGSSQWQRLTGKSMTTDTRPRLIAGWAKELHEAGGTVG